MNRALLLLVLCLSSLPTFCAEHDLLIIPRVAKAPAIDGQFEDECWNSAALITNFVKASTETPSAKKMEARICCDASNLYLAVTCEEPNPDKIRAAAKLRGEGVWTDDCIEVWIRPGSDRLGIDQFITNSNSLQEELRKRGGKPVPWKPAWEVKCAKGEKSWQAEFKIPAADLDLRDFARGQLLGLKIGREDHTQNEVGLAVWPPKAPYAGFEGFARAYIEDSNLLINADLKEKNGWGIGEAEAPQFSSVLDHESQVIKIQSPGRYCAISQNVRFVPNTTYQLSVDVKASGPLVVRARAKQADPKADGKFDLTIVKSDDYQSYSRLFTSGPEGQGMLVLSTVETSGTGSFFIRNLQLTQVLPPASSGQAIPLTAGDKPTTVTKLRVTDCRAVRGFISSPVDGTLKSGQWDGGLWEYNAPNGGAGVCYAYRGNDGLHIRFADDEGFNALVVRGGVKAKLYRDAAYEKPDAGKLIAELPGQTQNTRAYFKDAVKTNNVSFFDVGDGFIADCSFFRVSSGVWPQLLEKQEYAVAKEPPELSEPIKTRLQERFENDERIAWNASPAGKSASKLEVAGQKAFHIISVPLKEETSFAAIGLRFKIDGNGTQIPFTIRVQDPLNPRLELHGADYELDKAGSVNVVCEFPAQIVPAGNSLWVTLRFDAPVTLLDPRPDLYKLPREKAFQEALEYRKFLLKGFYAIMSEARPWNSWWKAEDPEAFFKKGGGYAAQVREIVDTLDQCRAIDKDSRDDTVRQYHQWIYRNITRHNPPPFTPIFDKKDGLPEWAVLLHQAWMQAREIPQWWITNRMTPNGEIGGEVGDDTDMMGNYGAFPMFERDGAGGMVLDMAARLAATAQANNLEQGLNSHTTDSLHAYEEGINLDAQMPYWFYGDPVYIERCMIAARSLGRISYLTDKGHRHLRSIGEIGSADLRFERKPVEDGEYNFLMWHSALEAAAFNRHPAILKLLKEYADAWIEHQEPGKYASVIELPSEKAKTADAIPFQGIWGGQASFFMYVADLTGDAKYIKPLLEHINAFEPGEWKRPDGKMVPKHVAGHVRTHIPELMQMGMLNVNADKKSYCETENWQAALYTKGDKAPFIEAIKGDIEELQRYKHMYTTVECFTDRVFLYALINPSIAYTGGYTTRNKLNRNYAVSWEGFGTDIAALVTAATSDHLKVLICNLSDKQLGGRARLWRLQPGEYEMTIGPDADNDDAADRVAQTKTIQVLPGTDLSLVLPEKQVSVLELKLIPGKRIDDLYQRADLALSPLDIKIENGKILGVAHNIGNADAKRFSIALLDADDKIVDRKMFAELKAPVDLEPSRLPFEFDLPANAKGLYLLINDNEKVPEIYQGNNRVRLGSR